MKLILENVRSISNRQEFEVKPLTFLVGENSTGKTTFLAMLAAALSGEIVQTTPDFNISPFDLGSFDNIASFRGGKAGRSKRFTVGLEAEWLPRHRARRGQPETIRIVSEFRSDKGQIVLASHIAESSKGKLTANLTEDAINIDVEVKSTSTSKNSKPLKITETYHEPSDKLSSSIHSFAGSLSMAAISKGADTQSALEAHSALAHFIFDLEGFGKPPLAMAPVRSKPSRTYDDLRDDFRPGGDHIPLVQILLFS
ncbi:MAG: AAA family ATPase [Planctomycetota bacterium]